MDNKETKALDQALKSYSENPRKINLLEIHNPANYAPKKMVFDARSRKRELKDVKPTKKVTKTMSFEHFHMRNEYRAQEVYREYIVEWFQVYFRMGVTEALVDYIKKHAVQIETPGGKNYTQYINNLDIGIDTTTEEWKWDKNPEPYRMVNPLSRIYRQWDGTKSLLFRPDIKENIKYLGNPRGLRYAVEPKVMEIEPYDDGERMSMVVNLELSIKVDSEFRIVKMKI